MGGALCPPTPRKRPPPYHPFFLVLVQAATVFSIAPEGGAVRGPDQAALSGRHGPGCSQGPGPLHPSPPLFAVRLPLTHTCRLLNGRRSGPGTVRLILGASCGPLSPWIEPGPGANVSLFPTKDLRGAAN